MNVTTIDRPLAGEPLLPPATHRLRGRLSNFLISTGLCAPGADALEGVLANGFLANHERGVVMTATSCDRPLFYREAETLARLLPLDLILMRFDPLTGATFDVLLAGSRNWLSELVVWRRGGDEFEARRRIYVEHNRSRSSGFQSRKPSLPCMAAISPCSKAQHSHLRAAKPARPRRNRHAA